MTPTAVAQSVAAPQVSVRTVPGRFYRPELDVLRLCAFLMVLLHHSMLWQVRWLHAVSAAGGAGLQLFFLLSSYLITELLVREHEKTGTVHIPAFFSRRILRIWPLYFLFVGGSMIVSRFSPAIVFPPSAFVAFMLLAGNWWVYFHSWLPNICGALWSISIEEQFYVVWPFLARVGNKTAFWIGSLSCLVIAYAALAVLGFRMAPRYMVWTNSFVEFQFFAAGAILALVLRKRRFAPPSWMRPLLFLAGAFCVRVAVRFNLLGTVPLSAGHLVVFYPFLLAGVCLYFLSFYGMQMPSAAAPLIYLGKISYGLYVFHLLGYDLVGRWHIVPRLLHATSVNPLGPDLLAVLLTLLFSVAAASLSYRFIEMPFLNLKRRFTFIRSREV